MNTRIPNDVFNHLPATLPKRLLLGLVMGCSLSCAFAAPNVPSAIQLTATRAAAGKTKIDFSVTSSTDIEVAVLNSKGKVIRHLAAGMLGAQVTPPAPLKPGLSQSVEWDGKDDYGQIVPIADCTVQVRSGMGVKIDKIVGGDPYAFYSQEMGQGDHARWGITGLEAKPDGNVYLMGNANNYGPVTIRQYDARGNYKRTVFPFPAGKPVEAVKGWGINILGNGTYTPKCSDLEFPSLTTTPMACSRHSIASLLPSPDKDSLMVQCPKALWNTPAFRLMKIGTDGSISKNKDDVLLGPLIVEPAMDSVELVGPGIVCQAPDAKHFYVSGLYASKGKRQGAVPNGFWRDGQVWKVDAATGTARPFFALDEASVIQDPVARAKSPIADSDTTSYAALHGVAVTTDGHVLVCDRQNKRIAVLDKEGKLVREIPVDHPDAIALSPKSNAIYVTTRNGNYHKKGELKLLKFNDWTKDNAPALTLPLCQAGVYPQPSYLMACQDKDDVLLWVAFTQLPARIYRDTPGGLELVKDFYLAGPQRELDVQHFVIDPLTEALYLADGWGCCYRIGDWNNPQFTRCMQGPNSPLAAIAVAVDARNRFLYTYTVEKYAARVARYKMDGEYLAPTPLTGSAKNEFTPPICFDWNLGLGYGVRGLAVAPDGSLATLGVLAEKFHGVPGPLTFFKADQNKTPWAPMPFKKLGDEPTTAGVQFDFSGNLYVGVYDKNIGQPPPGFENDRTFLASLGRIHKYAPTGSLATGNLFPLEPSGPAKVYNVSYGSIAPPNKFPRTARFGVDGYGRIYYPSSLEPRVSVIDNEGNAILSFGTYGNRDSLGGLPGDLVPTRDIPMARPNSVVATDNYLYVSDIVNIRLLRLAKTFVTVAAVDIK